MKEKIIFLIGMFLSAIVGWMLGYLRLPFLEKNFSFLLGFIFCLSFVLLLLILMYFWKRKFILLQFLNKKSTTTSTDKSSNSYSITWILISTFILTGAFFSSFFLHQQNKFSKIQNKEQYQKISEEMILMESTRQSNLLFLMNTILELVEGELQNNPKRNLSDKTIEKIAALNYSFQPTYKIEGDTLAEKKLSPERGQLLLMLSKMEMDSISYEKIKSKTSFEGADLRGADLKNTNLSGVDLRHANLKNANMSHAELQNANFTDANLWGVNLEKANLTGTKLNRADMRWANLDGADLKRSQLNGANLENAKLRNVDLRWAILEWSDLRSAFLNDAQMDSTKLTGADLRRANLENVNFTGANLQLSILVETNFEGAKLDGINLNKAWVNEKDWFNDLIDLKVTGVDEIKDRFKIIDDVTGRHKYWIRKIED